MMFHDKQAQVPPISRASRQTLRGPGKGKVVNIVRIRTDMFQWSNGHEFFIISIKKELLLVKVSMPESHFFNTNEGMAIICHSSLVFETVAVSH